MGSGLWRNGSGPASAVAVVHPDGTSVCLTEGSPDVGGTAGVEPRSTVAESPGPPGRARSARRSGHTDAVGFTSVTGGSGVTFKTGWAAYDCGTG